MLGTVLWNVGCWEHFFVMQGAGDSHVECLALLNLKHC